MIKLRIISIINETETCKTFHFAADEKIEYEAGQFLTFEFTINGNAIRRSYSLSSNPYIENELSITVKREDNGLLSRWWIDEAKVCDNLICLPPAGMFTIKWQNEPRDIYLAAAGSGIAPLLSLLNAALIKEPQSRIHLLYSNSRSEITIFLQELLKLQQVYSSHLTITWLFSDNKDLNNARLSSYNLQKIVKDTLQFEIKDALMYTCGPYEYMMMVQVTSLTMGFNAKHVRRELFDTSEPSKIKRRNFDTTDRTITIIKNGKEHAVYVPYHQTILQAALANKIDIPYSCRIGRCSTCVCKVLGGEVWMHSNEVLTDEDEIAGYALACTGHPATEDVIIQF
ncbi:ferredoxin--NADP reductase [soil metagenome]